MTDDRAAEFVQTLADLERGDLARLKRNAGETIGSARGVAGLFYSMLPDGVAGGRAEETYFLVATLYGLNCKYQHTGDFGTTMARIKAESGSASIDRRMGILLDSEFGLVDERRPGGGELAYRLRQLVKLAAGKRVGVEWPLLLRHLTDWNHPDRWVRKRWAQSYYGGARTAEPAETVAEGE